MTIAAPVPATTTTTDDLASAQYRLFGLVRDIRVEAQHVSRALEPARRALALSNEATRVTELNAVLPEIGAVLDESRLEVGARLAALRGLVEGQPRVYDEAGDAIAEIENQWRALERALAWGDQPMPDAVSARLSQVDGYVSGIEWQAAILTIPVRVRQHLKTKRVGGQLHFHDAFRDEVDDEGQRVALLGYLREHAASFQGVVDVPTGVIYRIGATPARRAASWVAVIGLATAGAYLFVYVLTHGIPAIQLTFSGVDGIGEARFPELMGAYWALLIGAIAHVVVEAIKQDQRSDPIAFRALADWFVWVHVRETALIVGVLSLYAILVGLALLMPKAGDLTFVAAFGAGYSFDSILGLFVTRFDGSGKAAAELVSGRLAAPSTGGSA
jgi:hypothetical protein